MKKTIICNIPMKDRIDASIYTSEDQSIPVSSTAVRFPINAFLEATADEGTELKVVLLAKAAEYSASAKNTEIFKAELEAALAGKNIKIEYAVINTDFSQTQVVHEQLMGHIIDEIEDASHIIVDITYGSKDLPVILFSALGFAEKFLGCEIENIIYGQAEFFNGKAVNTKICDMSPLFYLSSLTETVHADSSDKARQMLKSLLSV